MNDAFKRNLSIAEKFDHSVELTDEEKLHILESLDIANYLAIDTKRDTLHGVKDFIECHRNLEDEFEHFSHTFNTAWSNYKNTGNTEKLVDAVEEFVREY